jgi:hypothetical protein
MNVQVQDIRYGYAAVPTIKRFSQSRKFIRGLMGPFGSGKSSGCVIEIIKWARRQPLVNGKRRSRFAVIRNTYGELADTTIRTFFDWLPPADFGTWMKSEHVYVIDRLDPELHIEILFRALDRPEHVAKLLSLELTGAWINEAREVPHAIFKGLQGRVGRYPKVTEGGCTDPGIIMDTNPPDDESWWYRLFEEVKPSNCEIYRQPSGRAPDAENKPFLPANYYENLILGADADFVKVYVDGEYGYVKDGKPIYPEYIDSLHCMDVEPVPGVKISRGWDFGLTPACVFTQIHPDGRWLIFDELCADDLGIDTFAESVLLHVAQKYPGFAFEDWGDPAGNQRSAQSADKDEKTCFDILRGKGIQIQASEQNLTIRLESVRKPLNTLSKGKPQLQLHSRCKRLRKGFQGRYQYRKLKVAGAEERYHAEPDKNEYSHPHDAVQYVAVKAFGQAVRSRELRRQTVQTSFEQVCA